MKPRLNSHVYVLYKHGIYKEKVVAIGKDIFIHEGCLNRYNADDYRAPLRFDEYKICWFKTLKEIKEKYKIKLYKAYNGDIWWEIVWDGPTIYY